MAFKKLNANAPPDAELWNRGQLNIEQAFAEFASPLNVRRIFSSASVKQEMVLASDRYLIVDARGGPIRIVLPVPSATQAVTIKNATASTNAVTIVQADGKAMGDGEQSIAVTAHSAVRMVCDRVKWWQEITGAGTILPPVAPLPGPTPTPVPPIPPPASISGPFWMSTDVGVALAVDMGALGTGVLQQTVTAGVSTPAAVAIPEHAVLFGGSTGLIDYDVSTLYYNKSTVRLGLGTNAPWSMAHLLGASDVRETIETASAGGSAGITFANSATAGNYAQQTARIYYTGDAWVGGAEGSNALVLATPYGAVTPSQFAMTLSNSVVLRAYLLDAAIGELVITAPQHVGTGIMQSTGLETLSLSNDLSHKARLVFTSSAVNDIRYSLLGQSMWLDNPYGPIGLLGTGLTTTGLLKVAGATTGVLSVAVAGVDYQPAGTYVTSVGGTSPIVSSGGTTPVISILDFVASGASHARGAVPDPGASAGTTRFLREDATWAVPPGGGGTVTSVSGTLPITSTGGTTPVIGLNYDNVTITLSGAAGTPIQRAALTGVINAAAGSNATTFPNFSPASILANATGAPASPGIFAATTTGDVLWYTGSVLQWGHIPVASVTGAAPDTRNINTTAPLTGGGNLSADRTLGITDFVASGASHARGTVPDPGAVAGTTKFLCENASWAVPPGTGQPVITWPAIDEVLYSDGTAADPIGSAWLMVDRTPHSLIVGTGSTGRLNVQATGGEGSTSGTYALSVLGTTTYDKAWFGLGGKQIAASGNYAYLDLEPNSTSISSGAGVLSLGILATMRIRSAPWTGGGGVGSTIAEQTSLYIEAPANPAISPTLTTALHVASGLARFDGTSQWNQGADIVFTGTTSISFNGDGNSHNVSGSSTPVITGVGTASSQRNGEVQILFFTSSCTVKHNGTGPVPFDLTGGVDFSAVNGSTLTVVMRDGNYWKEIARS